VKIKVLLSRKYGDIARAMIAVLGKRMLSQANSLIDKYQGFFYCLFVLIIFSEILNKLTDRPHSPEELIQKREYLQQLDKEINGFFFFLIFSIIFFSFKTGFRKYDSHL
jgi:hypothetical protein